MTNRQQPKLRKHRRSFAAAVAAMLMMFSMPSGAVSPAEREYDNAVRLFRGGRTSHAFGQFIDLANRGDVDSARIALFLYMYGPVLFGKEWDAGTQDVAYWTMLVRNSGASARPMPEFAPTVLTPSNGKSRPAQAKPRPMPALSSIAKN
jgi:hypothetical protein